jgi:hypothetical protein
MTLSATAESANTTKPNPLGRPVCLSYETKASCKMAGGALTWGPWWGLHGGRGTAGEHNRIAGFCALAYLDCAIVFERTSQLLICRQQDESREMCEGL